MFVDRQRKASMLKFESSYDVYDRFKWVTFSDYFCCSPKEVYVYSGNCFAFKYYILHHIKGVKFLKK